MAAWEGLGNPAKQYAACGVGAIAELSRPPRHEVVEDGLKLLKHLDHRGARGAEKNTGDGAGILLIKPHEYFCDLIPDLPAFNDYAVGQLFLPKDETLQSALMQLIEETAHERHFTVIAWRKVPVDSRSLGTTARTTAPDVVQVFLASILPASPPKFDANLYLLRRQMERYARTRFGTGAEEQFYFCSLDRITIVYKGMLTSEQLPAFYPDLLDKRVVSSFVLVHSRFSTNTLGAWHLAHPSRHTVHNGEFNTLRGNENWMRAREADLASPLFGEDIDLVRPVITPGASDSAKFDNVLELLLISGWSLPAALRVMIAEAWEKDDRLGSERREFYDYYSTIMEPWDGPALVVATDGTRIAAVLDRNGFRPCRYCVTGENRVVLASEAGVLDIDRANVTTQGRLKPGQLLTIDISEGKLLANDEVFEDLTDSRYGAWLRQHRLRMPHFNPSPSMTAATDRMFNTADKTGELHAYQRLFGYTQEILEHLLTPMAEHGKDPVGSMGNDAPLEALSNHGHSLAAYFRQLFAQVANPPLDFIRERVVTTLRSHIGRKRNLLEAGADHCRQILIDSPILTEWELKALKCMNDKGVHAKVLDGTFPPRQPLGEALRALAEEARIAIISGQEIVVISDRHAGPDRIPLPALLAIGVVHQSLIREGLRLRAGIILDTGEAVTVHHVCCLIGYGADAIYPWLACENYREPAITGWW